MVRLCFVHFSNKIHAKYKEYNYLRNDLAVALGTMVLDSSFKFLSVCILR